MGANDYENLDFQVNVEGTDSAVSRLDQIIQRLEYIYKLQGKKLPNNSSSTNVFDDKQDKQIKRTTHSLGKFVTKLTSTLVIARKLGHFFSGAIKESAEYVENLNLFAVAYGKNYQQQLDWAIGIAEAYGLANNEVLKFAGTFRELSTSLGLVGDTADLVTKTVTNLGYDLSALFNTTVEQAMEKLQSGVFSGNVRPLRAYGIDISQNQIDALFKTNEALAQLGVNARNLNQSDKVLARLIITLQSGKDSFGTMAREINNLQSQFRIFQGSLSNFKLAIGDLLEKPLSKIMVLLNAVVIAMTNVIRTFVPLTTEDKTPKIIQNTALSAEEANKEIDELNGKLASFDKFNVLQQGSGSNSNLAVTEALNKMLQEQANLYDQELTASLEKMQNEAVELAKKIEDVVVIVGILLTVWSIAKLKSIISTTNLLKDALAKFTGTVGTVNKGLSLTNTLLVSGIVYAIYKAIKAFKEGDTTAGALATTMVVSLVGAWALLNKEIITTMKLKVVGFFKSIFSTIQGVGIKLIDWYRRLNEGVKMTTPNLLNGAKAFEKQKISAQQCALAIGSMVGAYFLADSILNSFDEEARKTASTIMIVVGAVMALTASIVAMNTSLSWGTMLPVLLAGVGTAIAGVKGMLSDVKSIQGFANGGYTNANLIMTHENGKREWVGKAHGSSAIVNDTQMSDIMEVAVAKGVYQALSTQSAMGGTKQESRPIVVQVDGKSLLTAMQSVARREGLGFAKL